MAQKNPFTPVGLRPGKVESPGRVRRRKPFPWTSAISLGVILLGCLFAEALMTHDPGYLALEHINEGPGPVFFFGTDALGRDIFSGIWYGGRISIAIGFLATFVSTVIALIYGTVSGLAPQWLDTLLMRFAELFLSVPGVLLVLFLQAMLGSANVLSLSLVIGVTGWASIAKVVRTEVRQLRTCEYVVASRSMGGGFWHILLRHLTPNFIASTLFMVVMNVRSAISLEATLSFLGMGLPLETVSWGSMLSLAEKALLTGSWWMILIPGGFLVTLMLCLTSLGNYLRKAVNPKGSNL